MPTGYTANLMEKGESFRSFTLRCARAFGACVTMRDDDMDAPLPEKFEPDDYHIKALAEAKRELKRLSKMTVAQQKAYGTKAKRKDVALHKEMADRHRAEDARLDAMATEVEAWNPASEIEPMKTFMLEQIRISRNGCEYWDDLARKSETKPALTYYTDDLASAVRDIQYHREEYEEELERVKARNDWLQQLRMSLPA